ncbi:DUF859 family phage minor structural protein, partial [Bacillus pumilus]|uniref:DUF859 family phage minor structural protein n=1 Tax=Bacillus pumilus TaxID=1408 RepID=UPI00119D7B97
MALSGSFGKDVNSHWRLQADWTATQNISNNESTITLKLYWIADKDGGTSTSATKSGSVSIDGSSSSFSGAGLAKLSNSQKKLIKTYSKTVSHNSDGTKSVSLSAYFDVELSLGSYVGRVSISGTANLNTIPRASTLSSTASWTAGNNKAISISRASSSFTHTVKAYVGGTLIKTLTGVASTATFSFSTAENTKIFEELSQGASTSSKIEVLTYNSGKLIGTTSRSGGCNAPNASTLNMSKTFNIGASISGSFNSSNSSFVHNLRLYNGGTFLAQLSLLQKSSFSYDSSEISDKLYSLTPNSNSLGLKVILYTMYNGVQVQGGREYSLSAIVTNSNPTFNSSQVSYKDTNTTTTSITGNDQYIIQGYSNLTAYINSGATAKNYATISKYEISIGGKTETLTGTGSKAFGKINTNSNTTMSIKVTDSRGNIALASKSILVIPYGKPVINSSTKRKNNFENETTISANGSFSLINIGGSVKNAISTMTYRYRRSGGTYSSLANFSRTTSGDKFTASNIILNLDNTSSFDIEITVKDKLEAVVVTKTVSVGKPIFYIDAVKKSLGFNDFPVNANEFRFNGRMIFGSNQWLANSQGEGAGAMFLNNSDITGV